MDEVLKLKKRLVRMRVIAVILFVFCLLFFVFGSVQRIEADRHEELSREIEKKAVEYAKLAGEQKTISEALKKEVTALEKANEVSKK